MFQDLGKNRYDNSFSERAPEPTSRILVYRDKGTIVGRNGEPITFREFRDRSIDLPLRYLFSIDGEAYYLCEGDFPEIDDFEMIENIRLQEDASPETVFAEATGASLARWYRTRRYCGCCGGKLVPSERERSLVCEKCHLTEYPKISPAVIVGITDGDRLLCSKYRIGYNRWALIAGFAEIGESIEDTVHREVMEETGLKVKNLRYFKSQPWPFSDSMLFGFFCDLDGDDTITLQEDELAVAQWFPRSDLPEQTSLFSLTSTMMEAFRKGKV